MGAPGRAFAPLQAGLDYHSFANIEQFRVTRLELELRLDPAQKVLRGVVGLQIKRLDPGATELILDTRDLSVAEVTQKAQDVLGATSASETTWVSRPYHLDKRDPILGQALVIELPPSRRPTEFIRIEYETSPTAPALQWLSAKQTRHKAFLYSKSTPIGARSWMPLQDTPQVRVTYKAVIHTSSDVLAVMSAKNDAKVKRNGDYAFSMPEAIPSHLIALAVGDFKFEPTGPRSGVYADKSLLKQAVKELVATEALLAAAEKLLGPYRWERYDIVVMPPSFPVDGVQNPRACFLSATALSGDGRVNSVLARQIAQAWAGDLVTNAAWGDAWLSLGFAAYIESRLIEEVFGTRVAGMDRVLGLEALREAMVTRPPADQGLAVDLRDRDPTDAYGIIPEEKGRLFLTYLEVSFGRERFDAFLRGYFERFALQSVSTAQFVQYLGDTLLKSQPGVVTMNQVLAWVNGPGIPPAASLPVTDGFAEVDAARAQWLSGGAAKRLQTHAWGPAQWLYFLGHFADPLTPAQMAELDGAFGFSRTDDAELRARWLQLVIQNHYQPGDVGLEDFLRNVGRHRLIVPLYEGMMTTPAGDAQARRVYRLARPGYPAETVALIDAIVKPKAGAAESADE